MAFSEATVSNWNMTTDAGARAVFQAIHDRLSAVGLVQTSDTGQINLASAVTPTTNTDAGYEIWRFDDAAQGSDPIFFKLVYGWGSNLGYLRMTWHTGDGSNGSGTVSGAHTNSQVIMSSVPLNTTAGRIIASFVNGSLALGIAAYNSTGVLNLGNQIFGVIERLRDPQTNALKAGCVYSAMATASGAQPLSAFWLKRAGTWTASQTANAFSPSVEVGNKQVVGCYIPRLEPFAPLRGWLYGLGLADDDAGALTIHGASANYKRPAAPFGDHAMPAGSASISNSSPMICTD